MRGKVRLGTSKAARFSVGAAVNHQLPWPLACGDRELSLPKAGESVILGPKLPESGECRIKQASVRVTTPDCSELTNE